MELTFRFLRNRVFWLHFSFWLLYFTYRFIDISPVVGYEQTALVLFVPGVFNIIFSYTHYFLLMPLAIPKKRYLKYGLGVIILLAAMIALRAGVEYEIVYKGYQREYYAVMNLSRVMSMSWDLLSFATVISLINFTIDRFALESQKKTLENEKLNAELKYLKAQVNPHFLFNTLHNLNYLTQVKSDQASDVVVKLSNIMRYMIYDSDKPGVLLSKEIEYIKDYLALERIRLNHDFDLNFDTSGVEVDLEIAPLILIPFVENAFKHGVSDAEKNSWVKVRLESNDKSLTLIVENSVLPKQNIDQDKSGFGLENVRKRLDLGFPGAYELNIGEEEKVFKVRLKLMME